MLGLNSLIHQLVSIKSRAAHSLVAAMNLPTARHKAALQLARGKQGTRLASRRCVSVGRHFDRTTQQKEV